METKIKATNKKYLCTNQTMVSQKEKEIIIIIISFFCILYNDKGLFSTALEIVFILIKMPRLASRTQINHTTTIMFVFMFNQFILFCFISGKVYGYFSNVFVNFVQYEWNLLHCVYSTLLYIKKNNKAFSQ